MKRVVKPELLDRDAGTESEIRQSLADLRLVNRWFGGRSVMVRLLERVAEVSGEQEISLLDVGGASGDIPLAAGRHLERRGIRLRPVILERSLKHLDKKLPSVVGEGLSLPFADKSFSTVTASLFVHHLEPSQIVGFVNEALRVCRRAVLINDLRRHPLHLGLVYAGMPLYRSRLTRHDGPASVRRAYTREELKKMLAETQAARVEIGSHYLYRMGVIAWKECP